MTEAQTLTVSDAALQAGFKAINNIGRPMLPGDASMMRAALIAAFPHLALSSAPCSVEVKDILATLDECWEYFDNKADVEDDENGPVANAELRLLTQVKEAHKALSAILALSAAPCSVVVKKLEFEFVKTVHPANYKLFMAETSIGDYSILECQREKTKGKCTVGTTDHPIYREKCDDIEEGKAAAQADFDRRILSQIVTKPVDVAAVWNDAVEQSAVIADSCYMLTPDVGNAVRNLKKHALSPAEPARGDQWQPIETAPYQTVILVSALYEGGWQYHVYSIENKHWQEEWDEYEPTHWMPLPSAPTLSAGRTTEGGEV